MKNIILQHKYYETTRGRKNTILGFKRYSELKDSVEINMDKYLSAMNGKEAGFNSEYLKQKQVPFKKMLFTKHSEECEYYTLFILTGRPLPLYELHMFDLDENKDSKKRPDLLHIGTIHIKQVGDELEFCYPEYKEAYSIPVEYGPKKSDEIRNLAKELVNLKEKHEMLSHRLFEIRSEFMEETLYEVLCAFTYIMDCRVHSNKSECPEEIDNSVLEITGDKTRTIQIKPGFVQGKYKLLNKRSTPREHNVRGYFKHFKSGKITFVESYKRGDPNKGVITTILEPVSTKVPTYPQFIDEHKSIGIVCREYKIMLLARIKAFFQRAQ